MEFVNSNEAKTQLTEWIRRSLAGERIVIAQGGVPLVELKPYPRTVRRQGGVWKGQVHMSEDFDEPLTDLEREIYGNVDPPA